MLEDAKQAAGREDINNLTHCWTLHVTVLTCQLQCAHWCNSGMTVMRLLATSLLSLKFAQWEGILCLYCGEVLSRKVESAIVNFLMDMFVNCLLSISVSTKGLGYSQP